VTRLKWKLASICLESTNLDARKMHNLRRMYHRHRNYLGRTQWNLLGDMGHAESCFSLFGDSVSVGAR
jgi:hypothetical protein